MQKDFEIVTTLSLRYYFDYYLDYDSEENVTELPLTVKDITDYIKTQAL